MKIAERQHIPHLTKLFIALCAVLAGVICALNCPAYDDAGYARLYRDTTVFGEPFAGFGKWLNFIPEHFLTFNGRIPDKFMPLMSLLPPLGKFLLEAAVIWLMLTAAVRLASGNRRMTPSGAVVCAASVMLLVPWFDNGFLSCMVLNYHLTIFLNFLWLWLFVYADDSRRGRWRLLGLILLSLLAGGCHEGESVLLLPGIAFAACKMRPLSMRRLLMICAYVAGAALILVSPGLWNRADVSIHRPDPQYFTIFVVAANVAILFLAACAVLFYRRLRHRRLPPYSRPEWLLITIFALQVAAITLLFFSVGFFIRMWWFGVSSAIVGLAIILHRISIPQTLTKIAASLIGALVLANFAIVVYYQSLIKQEHDAVILAYRHSPDGVVYHDFQYIGRPLPLCLRRQQRDLFMTEHTAQLPGLYRTDDTPISLLPTVLRDSTAFAALPTTPDTIVRKSADCYLVWQPALKTEVYGEMAYLDDAGQESIVRVTATPIPSGRPGVGYVCLRPAWHSWQTDTDIRTPLRVALY